jgi:HSP20 family molecular chaperone IbpA
MSKALTMHHEPRIRAESGSRLSLTQIMPHLIDELARLRNDRSSTDHSAPPFERWADHDHVYLEAELPGSQGLEADISFQGGRVFLCVSRRPVQDDSIQGNATGNS